MVAPTLTINAGVTVNAGVTLNGFAPAAPTTYWANGSGFNTDFAVFPNSGDPWGARWNSDSNYLEVTQSAWTNTAAFLNLISGTVIQVDPAGFGFLIEFVPSGSWIDAGGGIYRLPSTTFGAQVPFDSGITDFKFTY